MSHRTLLEMSRGARWLTVLGVWLLGVCMVVGGGLSGRAEAQSWKAEWEKTVKAAEKEGEVAIYIPGGTWQKAVKEFDKAYPKIKMKFTVARGFGSALANRLMSERRAGKFIADLYIIGWSTHVTILGKAKAIAPMEPAFILPEVKDKSAWFGGKYTYVDPEQAYSFVFERYQVSHVYYNTNLTNASEFKSYRDLLKPKWKGKIVMYDPRRPGPSAPLLWFMYANPSLGPEYVKQLFTTQDIRLTRDRRLPWDWVGSGQATVCLACPEFGRAKKVGLPVEVVTRPMKEGFLTPYGRGVMSLVTPTAHPNAAKVFINWLLSRRGQIAFQETTARLGDPRNSSRIDIPKDTVPKYMRLREGVKYYGEGPWSLQPRRDAMKLVREITSKKR